MKCTTTATCSTKKPSSAPKLTIDAKSSSRPASAIPATSVTPATSEQRAVRHFTRGVDVRERARQQAVAGHAEENAGRSGLGGDGAGERGKEDAPAPPAET